MEHLLFLVLLVVLVFVYTKRKDQDYVVKSPPRKCGCKNKNNSDDYAESSSSSREGFTMPKKEDPKDHGEEYLSQIVKETFDEGQQMNHQQYVQKRRAAGDHTLQLWGVNDSIRGYATNYVGMRRPRQIRIDPTSAIQPDTTDLRDYVNPENVRLI